MPEKRKTRLTGGQVKAKQPTTQTSLKDLFQRVDVGTAPGREQGLHPENADTVAPSLKAAGPRPFAQPSRLPKPSRLYPIFTKVTSLQEGPQDTVIRTDDTEVVDITDVPSDIELSTEPPLSSTHHPSPRSGSSTTTSHSPPPSPTFPTVHHNSDTSIPHASTHVHTRPHKTYKKEELNKRILGLGDVAPFPSSFSQHVRGAQHSFNSHQAALKRSVFRSFSSSDEQSLDCIAKWWQLDDATVTRLDRVRRSLTPQQCTEYLRYLNCDCTESHPAFAQLSPCRERVPLHDTEMWTRRFRPRCANEVLGNERRALYLRDWLHALELHLQDRQRKGPLSDTIASKNKEKSISKKVESRGVKRPRVIRAVSRKRGNKKRRVDSDDELDDFVVFSDADEVQAIDPPEDSEDELAFCQRTLAHLHRCDTTDTLDVQLVASHRPDTETDHTRSQLQGSVQANFDDNLTNTLLITGPPGCGKTAAVYACAEELGWEVFEAYPGIGKRNGASLDHLVGDVGRNHIVQTVHRRAPTNTTTADAKELIRLRDYLTKSKTGKYAGFGKSQEAGSAGQPISVEGDSPTHELQPLPPGRETESSDEAVVISGKCHGESDGPRSIIRQSLVLLEEVDILFKEDAGFWPAVVDLIRSCQRPVVMTCNDPGLVPVGDLPLQTILVFEPCPSPVAATFLQCVSLMEGCLVPHEDLMVLYESTHSMDGLDIPDVRLYPRTEPVPLPDLRRSITQLQMLCAGARHGSASEMHQGDEAEGHVLRSARPISAASRVTRTGSTVESEWWRKMNRHSELMSHVDAELCRMPMGTGEVVSDDEEMGYVVLKEREGLVLCGRDELIAEEVIRHSHGLHEECGTGPMEASINPATGLDTSGFRARVEYQTRMAEVLQDVLGLPAALMPQRSVFLDYIPWVRHMVSVDDALERRAIDGRGGGRSTRNSLRTVHARTVVLDEGGRDALRRSRLGEAVDGSTGT